jgi:hypothetical protein
MGQSSLAGASSCTAECVDVSGTTAGDGTTNSTSGSPLSTIDDDEGTFFERKTSAGCPPCGAAASVSVTYTLAVPTKIDSISIVGYEDHNTETSILLTFGDGSTTTVQATPSTQDFAVAVLGPWANVASVQVTLKASFGSQGGGGGWVRLYETRIKAAGLIRVTKC